MKNFIKLVLLFVFLYCITINNNFQIYSIIQYDSNKYYNGNSQVSIYSYEVGNHNKSDVMTELPSNSNRGFVISGIQDGKNLVNYFFWSNQQKSEKFPDAVTPGEHLQIEIKNQNINVENYNDVRLKFNYIVASAPASILNLIDFGSLKVYVDASDENGDTNTYGPYLLYEANYVTTYYREKAGTKEVPLEDEFECVTENIVNGIPAGSVINSIKIVPYSNLPLSSGGDFKARKFEIVGYTNDSSYISNKLEYKNISETVLRNNVVNNMYNLATVKWSPKESFSLVQEYVSGYTVTLNYDSEITYYGMPYNNSIVPSTYEAFISQINDGEYIGPIDKDNIYAVNCMSSIMDALLRNISIKEIINNGIRFFHNSEFELLGNLNYSDIDVNDTNDLKDNYSEQDIYYAYSKLQPGDIIMAYPEGAHARLITGNTFISYKENGDINPDESYVIVTEATAPSDSEMLKHSNDLMYPGLSYIPNLQYTDITDLNQMKGKYSYWKINHKYTFSELYNNSQLYVPLTLKSYHTSNIENIDIIKSNLNSNDDIIDGLKGTIYTNYEINQIIFEIFDFDTNKSQTYSIYPKQTMRFSFYYETPSEIKEYISNLNFQDEISIKVKVLLNNQLENVLDLHLNKSGYKTLEDNGITMVISKGELSDDLIFSAKESIDLIDSIKFDINDKNYKIYNFNLLDNKNNSININDNVKMIIPFPENIKNEYISLYYLNEDKLVDIKFEIVDGKIEFMTDKLGVYLVVESNNSISNPNTNDYIIRYIMILCGMIISGVTIIIIFYKKYKRI